MQNALKYFRLVNLEEKYVADSYIIVPVFLKFKNLKKMTFWGIFRVGYLESGVSNKLSGDDKSILSKIFM